MQKEDFLINRSGCNPVTCINNSFVECTGLKEAWTSNNVLSDQDFPVVEGTVLTLSCRGGEEIEGDKTVTCVKDTEYQYTEEPKCCE